MVRGEPEIRSAPPHDQVIPAQQAALLHHGSGIPPARTKPTADPAGPRNRPLDQRWHSRGAVRRSCADPNRRCSGVSFGARFRGRIAE